MADLKAVGKEINMSALLVKVEQMLDGKKTNLSALLLVGILIACNHGWLTLDAKILTDIKASLGATIVLALRAAIGD